MTNVHFVLAPEKSSLNRLTLLGLLLQHCLDHGLSPFCLVPDQDYANFLDDYLWSDHFLFLPHCLAEENPKSHAIPLVSIGTNIRDASGHKALFNCTPQALSVFADDATVEHIEWIGNETSEKNHMRDVFRQYQAQKITPKLIRM